jgi:glucokinase
MILAGDVGGTKARLALYQHENGKFLRQQTGQFISRDFSSLEDIVRLFLDRHHVFVTKACFGVPGPVVNGEAKTTNLPWALNETQIACTLNIPAVKLVNDLVATIAAAPYFTPEDLLTLHEGKKPDSRDCVYGILAPGTGLGQAFLYQRDGQYHALASEGGHADFAPTTEIEAGLFRYLHKKLGRVSYERVLSGPGLVNIYSFLKDTGHAEEPPELAKQLQEEDPAAVISTAGLSGEYELCVKALDIFASVLGAQAGNLVLTLMALGGLYLGGGIPPKISQKLADGTVVASYLNKGRLSEVVKNTPLHVIRDDYAALLGAASLASRL